MISFSLPRTFGRMVGDNRQGYAIVAVMAILAIGQHRDAQRAAAAARRHRSARRSARRWKASRHASASRNSATFAAATTLTSTGAVNSFHDSYTALGGGVTMFNMMLGEVAPGGTGSGLYGMLVLAVITVFVAGLMVGRTPEYLGKKIGAREIKFASLYFLTTPTLVLVGTAVAMAIAAARAAMLNTRPARLVRGAVRVHLRGQQQRLGVRRHRVNTTWYNTALGLAMLLGRFLPIVFVLGLAGSLARQSPCPPRPARCRPTGRCSSAWSSA